MKIQLSYFMMSITAFFMPLIPLLIVVGICISLDTIFGIYRAYKKGEEITSRKLSNVISKMVLYQSCVLLFFLIEKLIIGDMVSEISSIPFLLTKLVAASLCFIELKSLDESYKSLYGYSLLKKIKSILMRAKEIKEEIK
jgi:hypothetical protein